MKQQHPQHVIDKINKARNRSYNQPGVGLRRKQSAKEKTEYMKHIINFARHIGESTDLTEALEYHVKYSISLVENVYRPGSDMFFAMIREAKKLYAEGQYTPKDSFEKQLLESDIGEKAIYEGQEVWLDFPHEEELNEEGTDKTHGHGIGKPFRTGGGGAVYVRTGAGGVKKVNFSQSGMRKRFNEPGRLKSFMARHHCLTNKDKTSASYWACRYPRYFSSGGQKWW
jgi:hypothetical protein